MNLKNLNKIAPFWGFFLVQIIATYIQPCLAENESSEKILSHLKNFKKSKSRKENSYNLCQIFSAQDQAPCYFLYACCEPALIKKDHICLKTPRNERNQLSAIKIIQIFPKRTSCETLKLLFSLKNNLTKFQRENIEKIYNHTSQSCKED